MPVQTRVGKALKIEKPMAVAYHVSFNLCEISLSVVLKILSPVALPQTSGDIGLRFRMPNLEEASTFMRTALWER